MYVFVSIQAMLSRFRPTSPVSTFSALFSRFSGVSAVTRGNVHVCVKLSYACPFLPDVARFHVFAHRLDVFGHFRFNMGQRWCPRQVKRRLPVFPDVSHFHVLPIA
jgi:hypothetical protein